MNTTFGIGNVLVTGFRAWLKNIVAFTLIAALIHAPVMLWGVSAVRGDVDDDGWRRVVQFLQLSPLAIVLVNILLSAALTYGVVMELQGQRASVGACIATGLRRFFPALGTTLLWGLCVGGAALVAALPLTVVSRVAAGISGGIVALWMVSMLYVSTQAIVIERPGVMGALGRSRALTEGHRFALFALFFVLQLLNVGLEQGIEAIALPDVPLYVYLRFGSELLVGSLSAVMAGVAYYFLRAEKEGTSAEELAAVFA